MAQPTRLDVQLIAATQFSSPDDVAWQADETATDAEGLEGGRDGQADCLFGARGIGHNKASVERIKAHLDTFDRSIKALQVDGYVLFLRHIGIPGCELQESL